MACLIFALQLLHSSILPRLLFGLKFSAIADATGFQFTGLAAAAYAANIYDNIIHANPRGRIMYKMRAISTRFSRHFRPPFLA
jgi:uncharacterized membrane protein